MSIVSKVIDVENNIILTFNIRDTFRPLGISFSPFTSSVRETKYRKFCSTLLNQILYIKMYAYVAFAKLNKFLPQ